MDEKKSTLTNSDANDQEFLVSLDENLRQQYLAAMNIPVWLPKNEDNVLIVQDNIPVAVTTELSVTDINAKNTTQDFTPQDVVLQNNQAILPTTYFTTNDSSTTLSLPAKPNDIFPSKQSTVPQPDVSALLNVNAAWEALTQQVTKCQICQELVANRSRTVFGVGNRQAQLLVIGEAPGADEDLQGEPFVGRAGQLLNAMLNAINIQREEVYIANILKCRPPNNRDPRPDEAANCERWLLQQIELVAPRIILAVGRIAAQHLLKTQIPIGKLRGCLHEYGRNHIPLIVTYHPAYLLRSPGQKAESWKDLQVVAQFLLRALPTN